jgi:intraflagellar transport protein 80
MRFKTSALKESKHTELVSCVAWMSTDDVVSISDDKKILKWNLVNSETKVNTNLKSSDSDDSYYVYIIVIGCS